MLTVARWVLFAISVAAIVSTGERLSRRATAAGDWRIAATGALSVAIAVAEALLLGLVGLGGNAIAITAAALVSWLVVRLSVTTAGPSSSALARAGWSRLSRAGRAGLGVAAALAITDTIYLMFRSAIGTDGLISHLAEPAMWVTDGHPGTMHPTITGFPIQAYPKTGEVLFEWAVATARTPVVTTLVMLAGLSLAAVCGWSVLRRLGVEQWVAVTLAAALTLCPIMIGQSAGPNTDMFTLTWILCSGALCLGAMTDSELLPIALAAGGLAVGTRTTAIPVVVVMLGATFWLRRRELLQHPLALSIGTATTLGTGVVWYLQDLAVYHAPLYPFSSLPSGPPVPKSISALDANFIHDPAGAIRIAHVSGYAHALGGGLVLILGVLIAAVLLPTVRDRRLRTGIAIAVGFSVAEAVVWSVTPFTGYSGDPSAGLVYVLAGTRYLLPGLAIFAVAVGLASRAGGLLGLAARGVAILGVATDLWALHRVQLGIRPHAAALVAAALVGAVAAVLAGEVRRTRPSDRRPVAPVAPVAVLVIGLSVAMIAVGTAATHGYLDRHIKLVRQLHIDEPDVLAMLERQPRWANGHLPVATGPVADALLAGPTFNHPLSVIAETESCADVRAAAHEGWVVLPSKPAPPPLALTGDESTYDRVRCLADVPAAFTADGLSVFAPTG